MYIQIVTLSQMTWDSFFALSRRSVSDQHRIEHLCFMLHLCR